MLRKNSIEDFPARLQQAFSWAHQIGSVGMGYVDASKITRKSDYPLELVPSLAVIAIVTFLIDQNYNFIARFWWTISSIQNEIHGKKEPLIPIDKSFDALINMYLSFAKPY